MKSVSSEPTLNTSCCGKELRSNLDRRSGFHQIVERLFLALVPHLRRKPDFESLFQGILGSRQQSVEIQTADANRIAVHIMFDDLKLAMHHVLDQMLDATALPSLRALRRS